MKATARVPGTCGELLQGVIGGRPFLVTCPVDRWVRATAQPLPGAKTWHLPLGYAKVADALDRAVAAGLLGLDRLGTITFDSQLARGKGMASSTADITAAIAAASAVSGRQVEPATIARIAAKVEPTDGIMHEGIVLFDQMSGELIQALGPPPAVSILMFDVGGTVDTLAFHAQGRARHDEPALTEAVEMLVKAFARQDPNLLGAAATQSAMLHQRALPKPGLERVWRRASDLGMLGVCVAHSGTVFGILASAFEEPPETATERESALGRLVQETMPGAVGLGRARLVSGGIRWEGKGGP